MEEKKLTTIKIVGGIIVQIAIFAILGYQIYDKVNSGRQNEIYVEIILAVLSVLLFGRILFHYFKQKKNNK